MKTKIFSLITILALMLPFFAEAVSISIATQPDNGTSRSIILNGTPTDDTNSQETILQIGDITLTIDVKETARRILITFKGEDTTTTEEIIVTPSSNGYVTSIYIDGKLLGTSIKDVNILEPVQLTTVSFNTESSESNSQSFHASYTYKWWDSIRYVTGPTYQIKYPHPDRDYYSIAPWNDWERTGSKLFHTQYNDAYSGFIAGVGWAGLFAAFGAYIGLRTKNTYAVVIGAVLGAVFGLYLQIVAEAVLLDEEGCLWWWSSRAMDNWLAANGWWIWFFSITGNANAFVWAAFVLYGYLRIGDTTFYDAVNAGSP
ncbi:MAG: hypothetical protein JW779_14890 [Candidatus Thorarchaeota archaeon]|nr:hypothetical protein [Candidatus Thorarchaeota archaeon]